DLQRPLRARPRPGGPVCHRSRRLPARRPGHRAQRGGGGDRRRPRRARADRVPRPGAGRGPADGSPPLPAGGHGCRGRVPRAGASPRQEALSPMTGEPIVTTLEAGAAVLTLNNPPLNLVTLALTRALHARLGELPADPAVGALVGRAEARCALPEVKLGGFPGGGGPVRVRRRVGEGRAKELMYPGEPIEAATARAWGLVNRVVPPGQALAAAVELARGLARG